MYNIDNKIGLCFSVLFLVVGGGGCHKAGGGPGMTGK